jgi:hypothetical protein
MVEDSIRIVQEAKNYGVILRVVAGCAIMIHCPKHRKTLEEKMARRVGDIDLVGLSRERKQVRRFMDSLGFTSMHPIAEMRNREEYEGEDKELVEIFFDKIELCHDIDLAPRVLIDFPTISLADLVLQKMQIVKVNEKDVQDIIVLLLEHELGSSDKDTINVDHLAKILSVDWGFYYTLTRNLELCRTSLEKYAEVLSENERNEIRTKINMVLSRIQEEPKSVKWKLRESVGTKRKWYREVEEGEIETSLTGYLRRKDQI